MPRPHKKLPSPKPADVTVRRIGSAEPVEVVSADELSRRKEEAEWQRYRRAHGLDVRDEHARLALQLGDIVTVPTYTGDVWWFVRDVNGGDRTITVGTFIFDQPRERTVPFDLVETHHIWGAETNEAAIWFERLQAHLGRTRATKPSRSRRSRAA